MRRRAAVSVRHLPLAFFKPVDLRCPHSEVLGTPLTDTEVCSNPTV